MPEIILQSHSVSLPEPRVAITIRPGRMEDVPFMDGLQKQHTKQVGWMPTAQFEGKIKAGHVLVAEGPPPQPSPDAAGEGACTGNWPLPTGNSFAGYLIGNDQYFKRDDVGIIYQINVKPQFRRSLVAAMLLGAQFERSAWGCRLYCCWCAQDIEANRFWEAMGFVPLAYRAGSETKGHKGTPRVHIFWQKRIRRGDVTTPWWFPAKTDGGAIRADRIVLPIPPGTHWSAVMPVVMAEENKLPVASCQLPEKREPRKTREVKPESAIANRKSAISIGGLRFVSAAPVDGGRVSSPAVADGVAADGTAAGDGRPPRVKKPRAPKAKCDPKLVAAARELRDRWLEQVNADPSALLPNGKYDVARVLASEPPPRPSPGAAGEGAGLLPAVSGVERSAA